MAALLVSASCREAPSPPAEPPQPRVPAARHVVLVTLDTLRADHLGAYGGSVETPHLDRWASTGAVVEQVSAHTPLTRPSHVSLMSGLLPPVTGVRDNVSPAVVPSVPLLAETLTAAGFETAAFVSSVVLSSVSGLDRGFAVYSDDFAASADDPRFLNSAQKRGDATVDEAIAWLEEKQAASRLFLWLHLYDPHEPYEPPEPYASRYRDRPYAGEVAWSDALIGRLDAALERLGLADETLAIVTSDHGEGLGEHDEQLHGFFVYESTLRVPLIWRGPRVRPGLRIDRVSSLVDIYPTILELVEVPADTAQLAGRSLAAALAAQAPTPETAVYAESLVPRLHFGWSDLRVVRQGTWKYIAAPRPELYDLANDPGELDNLVAVERRRVREMHQALEGFLAAEPASAAADPAASMPPELLARLNALGYVGGSGTLVTDSPGADPKDKIEEFRLASDLMRQGLIHLHEGQYRRSAAKLEELITRGIESAELHLYLGEALLGSRRFADAVEHLWRAAELTPARASAWLGLAEAHLQLGDAEAASTSLAAGQQALPRHAGLRREEGRLLRLLRRPQEARRAFAAAIDLAPDDAFSHAMLGEVLRDVGELQASAARLRQAVRLDPAPAGYWNGLGMTLAGSGELEEAEQAFREAVQRAPDHHFYVFNLGLALERLGRAAEARPLFERVLEMRPDFRPARERLAAPADRL